MLFVVTYKCYVCYENLNARKDSIILESRLFFRFSYFMAVWLSNVFAWQLKLTIKSHLYKGKIMNPISRRTFIKGTCASIGAVAMSSVFAEAKNATLDSIRDFTLHSQHTINFYTTNTTNIWLPLAISNSFQIPYNLNIQGNYQSYQIQNIDNTPLLYALWKNNSQEKTLQTSLHIRISHLKDDLELKDSASFTAQSRYIRTDGTIATIAQALIKQTDSELLKAKKLFNWVANNIQSEESSDIQGIRSIHSKDGVVLLRGENISASSVFVALCRAVGLEAIEAFGIKIDNGRYDVYQKQLSEDLRIYTRSAVKINNTWIPNDVILAISAFKVAQKDKATILENAFREWDNNWVLLNFKRDIRLHSNLLSTLQGIYGDIDGTKISSYDSSHCYGFTKAIS